MPFERAEPEDDLSHVIGKAVDARTDVSQVFKDEIGLFDHIEPDLMSLGLLEIWRRNRK